MATRTVVTLVDDVDGSEAQESISFGLDRVDYEIDLSTEHADALRGLFAPYMAAARRTGRRRSSREAQPAARPASSGTDGSGPARSRSTNAQIRAWAAEHGVTLAERGRLPGRVIEAFEAGDPTKLPASDGAAPEAPAPATSAPAAPAAPAASGSSSEDGQTRGRDGLTSPERETIRGWAVEQGIEVKPRGQLRKDLISNYRAWEARR
ncbi:MAG TPA: Lsr2 family protein [Actinomycetospora sp.]|jgi:hypothetical protein|uniref:histone-like nucleoid-structuring protein Lsr2 n=1 Tax=Actinomycetospora sp. TaxID=1872135 RepID=UPI002F423AA9